VLVVCRDVTEEHLAAAKLREREAELGARATAGADRRPRGRSENRLPQSPVARVFADSRLARRMRRTNLTTTG